MIFPNFPCVWWDMWSLHGGYNYHVLKKTSRSSLVLGCSSSSLSNTRSVWTKNVGPWIILPLWSTIHHPGISYDDSRCHKNLIGTQIQIERVGYSKTREPWRNISFRLEKISWFMNQFTRFLVVEGSCFALASGFLGGKSLKPWNPTQRFLQSTSWG